MKCESEMENLTAVSKLTDEKYSLDWLQLQFRVDLEEMLGLSNPDIETDAHLLKVQLLEFSFN